ncbi:2-aminoethanethiol dioxygenase [Galendromus occidentalis]|uniref:2-aminoethanethiol dioxygenase n=1 Tax=Galendromus occidentalis TaxID=34638 RepID=A0AAJ6QXN6_9ACAR|nr:2-aminoethanethiol dioxygenase [Galendromus occidentalis]
MSALIQSIVRQAKITFLKKPCNETEVNKLYKLVQQLTAADVGIGDALFKRLPQYPAPVLFIPVYDHEDFTITIFVLKQGRRIPMHNHPGMTGILKVLLGTARVESFSPIPPPSQSAFSYFFGKKPKPGTYALRHDPISVSASDDPCRLAPERGNIHEVLAGDGPVAFLDVLAPPYHNGERDCVYFKLLPDDENSPNEKCFLREIPAPEDFWCNTLSYEGPTIEEN